MADLNDLKKMRVQKVERMTAIVDGAGAGARNLTDDEIKEFTKLESDVRGIDATLTAADTAKQLSGIRYVDPPAPSIDPSIGLSPNEQKRYSIMRAVRACANRDWRDAGFELEVSRAVEKRCGKSPRSFFVPYDVLASSERRDVTKTLSSHTGEKIIATDYMSASFIDLLANRVMVQRAGARMMSGLVGDVAIPKLLTGSAGYWVAESGAPTEDTPTFGQVTLTPKTVVGNTEVTRLMMLQSDPSVEGILTADLSRAIALAIDAAALHGSGSSNQPTGIASTSGIGSVAGGTNGLAPAWSHIVGLETEVAIDNADIGSLSYITNAKVRGKCKTVEKASSTGLFLWGDGNFPLNGYPAYVTNQVSSTLTKGTSTSVCSAIFFGNWEDIIIGLWGGLDILVDPYTAGNGNIKLFAYQTADIAVRYAQSFAAMLDALTT